MNEVTSLILRRMRTPLLLIVTVYTVSILGLILIPGIDDHGNTWNMSIFHAFYFVSYTATTIGFGEIPYPLTNAQRLWTLFIVYSTVIAWFYALGKVITLFQNKTFLKVVESSAFERSIKNMNRPYYLVCGFGESGQAVVNALIEEHFGAAVIDINPEVNDLRLNQTLEHIPHLSADASDPAILEIAGVHQDKCRGVIALTSSDEVNLKIAIGSKLLHPNVKVVCRSEFKKYEENMLSFGTEHIITPFKSFANIFGMALHSPAMYLIQDWLTGAPNTLLSMPTKIEEGHWILCGYGRFGKEIHNALRLKKIKTIIIDPCEQTKQKYLHGHNADERFIVGTGTDAKTLNSAEVETAAGIIAGSDNDSNNLSIIMTARQLNKNIFIVGRQNYISNKLLYSKINEHYYKKCNSNNSKKHELSNIAHLTMRPSEIIAKKIREILIAPLLTDFIHLAVNENQQWANILISRLSAVVGEQPPYTWTVKVNKENSSAIAQALGYGRQILLMDIIKNPSNPQENLPCIALLLKRGDNITLLPEHQTELLAFDQILFCGIRQIKHAMKPAQTSISHLNYLMTSKNSPESYIWKKFSSLLHKNEQRQSKR